MNEKTGKKNPRYFYSLDDEKLGPVTAKELRRLVAEKQIARDTIIWLEGSENGTPAHRVKGLLPASSSKTEEPAHDQSPRTEEQSAEMPKRMKSRPRTRVTQRRLFLSCVTHEFRSYRDQLATRLAQPGVELRRQEDFVNAGQTTLEKLDDYIRTCDAVIHLVGHATGAYPEAPEVDAFLNQSSDLADKLGLGAELVNGDLSYTQWEAWLALYHGKPLALYRAADVAPREIGFAFDQDQKTKQQQHWKLLEERGRDRKEFASPDDLAIEVLRAMPYLVPGFSENVEHGELRDRNLLFAVFALQDEILSRDTFVRVCRQWAAETSQPISEVMQTEGLLTEEDRLLVEARLERKLRKRGGDVRQSLAECLGSDVRHTLGEALDPQAMASLPDRLSAIGNLEGTEGQWRYRLTRTHGSGGLGVVSVADDITLDRSVAVKQLRAERTLDPMAVERFVREARITGRLQHPNIVPIYELGLTPDDQLPFYAMRFVGHRSLQDAIRHHHTDNEASTSDRNVRFRELIQSFLSVCNAVAFAHEQGIIHRDLKPANVMIGDFGEVILLDWGLAKRLDEAEPALLQSKENDDDSSTQQDQTQAGVKLGTPAYMSPEQAAGRIDLHGLCTDVYGLGVILYEILTGDVPFSGASTDELLSEIQTRSTPDPRKSVSSPPAALAAICTRATEKEPNDRYSTAKSVADDIQNWLSDESVSAYKEPIVQMAQRAARKWPALVSSTVAAILVGMVGLSAGLYFVNEEKNRTEIEAAEADRLRELEVAARQDAVGNMNLANKRAGNLADALTREAKLKDEAINQKHIAVKQLVDRAEEEFVEKIQDGSTADALAWALAAAGYERDNLHPDWPRREPLHRARVTSLAREFPSLATTFSLGGELESARLSHDRERLLTLHASDSGDLLQIWNSETLTPVFAAINLGVVNGSDVIVNHKNIAAVPVADPLRFEANIELVDLSTGTRVLK